MRPWRAAIGVAILFAIPRCSCSSGSSEPDCTSKTATNAHFETESGICGDFCQLKCNSGFVNCDDNDGNGCEVSTTTAAPHEHVVDSNFNETSGGGCGSGGSGQVVGHIGSCSVECDFGFSDCDNNVENGCETIGSSCFSLPDAWLQDASKDASKDASDASTSGQLLVTLNGLARGLIACAGRIFYFDDDQLHAIDESSLTISIVTVSQQAPTGLACDGSYVYWTTLADADASTPNGTLRRATVDGTTNEVLATDLDPGRGIDVRPSGPIYFVARSGFGPGPNVVAAQVGDASVTLDTWMPTSEGPYERPFAWAASDDWSLTGGAILRRALGDDDAAVPWMPAPEAAGLLSDDAGAPYAVVHAPSTDAGPTDDFARLDDAGLIPLDASVGPIVATTSNAEWTIAASDDTVYVVSLSQGITKVIATTTDHVADVAYDAGWAVWTTRGGTNAQVWRAKVP
jgi:hypothetical protein